MPRSISCARSAPSDRLIGPPAAEFPFIDLASGERWTLRFNDGRLPLWIFDPDRRVPGTRVLDYLALARLVWPPPGKTVGEVIACKGPLYWRLVEPLLARRAEYRSAAWLGETGRRRDPRNAGRRRPRLPAADRARWLERDADRARARVLATSAARTCGSNISCAPSASAPAASMRSISAARPIALADDDAVILAVPPYAAAALIRGLDVPTEFRAIVNAHFRIDAAGRPAADPRRAQRHGGMDLCLSRPAVGDDQRRRSAGRPAARGTGEDDLGGGREP